MSNSEVDNPKYIPGICNIGPSERAKRRMSGIVGLIITIVVLIILIALGTSKYWRIIIFIPVTIAAAGFLQDALHFCAGYGAKGLYNVVNSAGMTEQVASSEYRRKDLRKAQSIIGLSVLIGLVVTALSMI